MKSGRATVTATTIMQKFIKGSADEWENKFDHW